MVIRMSSASTPQSHGALASTHQPVASSSGSNHAGPTRPTISDITSQSPSQPLCRFYSTKKGCRAGDQCRYQHEVQATRPQRQSSNSRPAVSEDAPARTAPPITQGAHSRGAQPPGQRAPGVSTKPVPDVQRANPREFQITQVIRRFSPQRREEASVTFLNFTIIPSDPDFPFELRGLQCELKIPRDYPGTEDARPTLRVRNAEIPRGYQINIERGFDSVAQSSRRTLLAMLNELDKSLERFLTSEKAQTIKLVSNASKPPQTLPTATQPLPNPITEQLVNDESKSAPTPMHSVQQRDHARTKRATEIRQLTARMSRNAQFSKWADDTSFTIPVQIPRADQLPVSLKSLKLVSLVVPPMYPLEPCRIRLEGVSGKEVRTVEEAFEKHARTEFELTLMAHVNFFIQNIHQMAAVVDVKSASSSSELAEGAIAKSAHIAATDSQAGVHFTQTDDRAHIQVIPRPPEWDAPADASDEDSSDCEESEDGSSELEEEDSGDEGGATLPEKATSATITANSIVLSFPNIELYGIELLEVASLGIVLKCNRCKSTVEIKNLRPSNASSDTSSSLTESCPKCAASLAVSFVAEPVHANSIKAGHLELTACTISDMLVSTFTPTCAECSTAYPTPPGVTAVRGDAALAVCRHCHRRMSFRIHETKFLRVAVHASGVPLPPRKRKQKENLGIVAGTPLPNFGICSHYRKSRRWFRFSCCGKVYPCDRCHDEQADPKHPNEHANRMLCGLCSREQNYRPEDCGICGGMLIGKRGGGFWEGGKGTRDKTKMSRKDPRKYKRRGGNATVGGG